MLTWYGTPMGINLSLSRSNVWRIAKYLSASAINTLLGILIIYLIYFFTKAPFLTLLLSATLGYLYSILSYHFIAFDGKGRSLPYKRYAITYFSGLMLNSAATSALLPVLHNFVHVQLFVVPFVVILQWFTSSFWVFKRNR